MPHKEGEAPPLALDAKGLARVRQGFVEATKRAMRLGLDAIELHCAHGYLLHQFLSPLSNMRTDQDGGTRPNRMRFPLEVVEAIRATFHCDSRSASKCRRLIGSKAAGILHRPLNLPKS